MVNVKDILKHARVDHDENGWYALYLFHYAEGGTRAEAQNNLLDKINREPEPRKKRHMKKDKSFDINTIWLN